MSQHVTEFFICIDFGDISQKKKIKLINCFIMFCKHLVDEAKEKTYN